MHTKGIQKEPPRQKMKRHQNARTTCNLNHQQGTESPAPKGAESSSNPLSPYLGFVGGPCLYPRPSLGLPFLDEGPVFLYKPVFSLYTLGQTCFLLFFCVNNICSVYF